VLGEAGDDPCSLRTCHGSRRIWCENNPRKPMRLQADTNRVPLPNMILPDSSAPLRDYEQFLECRNSAFVRLNCGHDSLYWEG